FWATWCGPCRAEIPDLVELQNRYKDQLQVIGLVVDDEDQDAIKKFVDEYKINYPVVIAPDELRFEYGGIPALPTSFLLDAEGRACGCQYTLAQCRIWDRNCAISKATTEKIVDELLGIRHTSADSPSPVKPAAPATPNGSAKPASSSPAKPSAPEKQPAPEKP